MTEGKRAQRRTGATTGGGDVIAMKPYPIGTAARLAGIPPETLRIWERRYKMLSPTRTEGGHRLYSERDVEILRAVKKLVDSGMRVGSVASMPTERILDEAARLPQPNAPTTLMDANQQLIDEILEAARSLDSARVASLLDRPRLLTDGLDVVTSLYLPLLHRVGELWHGGQLSVAEEHFVEKLVTARLHAILQSTPAATSGRLALCACPPDDRHEAGLLAAAIALKTNGFGIAFLGGDLPVADLIDAADKLAPAVLVIAATNELSEEARRALPRALEKEPLAGIPLILGGARSQDLGRMLRRGHEVVPEVSAVVAAARRVVS